jgi:hypothetical protein
VVKNESRVVVGLALLIVVLVAGAAGAAGHAAQWTVLDPHAVIGGDGAPPATAGMLGLSTDLGTSLDAQTAAGPTTTAATLVGGVLGVLMDHDLIVAVAATFLWVGIGMWAIRRSYGRGRGDGAAGQGL